MPDFCTNNEPSRFINFAFKLKPTKPLFLKSEICIIHNPKALERNRNI
jgi:hypothetical protein